MHAPAITAAAESGISLSPRDFHIEFPTPRISACFDMLKAAEQMSVFHEHVSD